MSLAGSFVKSVTGMGYPLIAIPVLSLTIGVEDAVVIIAIPNAVANLLLCVGAREGVHEARDLRRLAVPAIGATILGTVLLVRLAEEPLLAVLALTIVVYIVQFLREPEMVIEPAVSRRWSPVVGTAAGFMQGAVGVSGPIVAMWFHGYRLTKTAFVFSVTLFFLVAGATQAAWLGVLGEYDRDRLTAAGLALIATLVAIPLGTRARRRLDTATFERVVLVVLGGSAVALAVRAVSGA